MNKVVINENQKGFLFKNGKYIKMLDAGRYRLFGGKDIEIIDMDSAIKCEKCSLDTLLADENVASKVEVVEVADEHLALHFVNGKFSSALRHGKYAFFAASDKHEFKMVDISTPIVDESVPKYVFAQLPYTCYTKVEISHYEKGVLFFDNKLDRVLDAGTYYFWNTPSRMNVEVVDTRLTQMNILGQDMLTADKVSIRVNFVCSYRVADCVKVIVDVNDFEEQLHVAAQLSMREYVGKYKLDEILENKSAMSEWVYSEIKEKAKALYLDIVNAGVKDIILPGEVREIMNTVLVAEKRAQANVITRREEVASTRSLLNTAKLMEENKTLYKLKELEYIERICENVGNINIGTGADILSQLTSILSKND